jgi:hypothetical protein
VEELDPKVLQLLVGRAAVVGGEEQAAEDALPMSFAGVCRLISMVTKTRREAGIALLTLASLAAEGESAGALAA